MKIGYQMSGTLSSGQQKLYKTSSLPYIYICVNKCMGVSQLLKKSRFVTLLFYRIGSAPPRIATPVAAYASLDEVRIIHLVKFLQKF